MIKFGPSGNSQAFYDAGKKHSEESAIWVKEMGLDCFEYSFGRGVGLSDEKASSINGAFTSAGVEISVHAPYYVNFANPDVEMIKKSEFYLLESIKKGKLMGANRVVFHPASQGKLSREEAFNLTERNVKNFIARLKGEIDYDFLVCPETMGKHAQIGTAEEIVKICSYDDMLIPAIDFGHLNARDGGSLKTQTDYYNLLKFFVDELGYEKMKNFHVHFSKIEYGAKGEIRHLTFQDEKFGPDFEPLSLVLKTLKLEPYIICESAGTQDKDALYMKNVYFGK